MIKNLKYDRHFTRKELFSIHFLRRLDSHLKTMSVSFGILLFLVFFVLGGLTALSETTRRLCIGASCSLPILGAIFLKGGLDRYIEHAFLTRWDPLFHQRSAKSGDHHAEQAQMIALTENPEFLVLPIEEQRTIVESLHQKRQTRKTRS